MHAHVEEAIANFAAECVRKLKEQHSCCTEITVFAYTSRFRQDLPHHQVNRTIHLQVPSCDTAEIVSYAVNALRREWLNDGTYHYKKASVILWDICPDSAIQTSLFDTVDREKQARLASVIDTINRKNGHNTVKVAIQGTEKKWHLKSEYKSNQFTTDLDEIIRVT